jgi:omega-hydroxy-beta-dihydromenaquinone-9 sulfotransferase
MKDSYLLVGVRLGVLLRLIHKNRISILPKYLLRLLFLFINACWASLFAYTEKKRFKEAYNEVVVPDNPVIIIGHWRTGSTLLHQLMSLDPGFCSPTLFQTTLPDSFLFSRRYYKPVMSRIMPKQRPMDNVKSGFDEPQEDEYATFRLCGVSPLERLMFPEGKGYFLNVYNEEKRISEDDTKAWSEAFSLFCRKLYFGYRKRILLKNPFLSLRINEILSLYPDARFIHIYRNPLKVIPSTIHMWDTVGRQNCLNRNGVTPEIKEVTQYFNKMIEVIREALSNMPKEKYIEIKYEDLVKDPLNGIQCIYEQLGIPFTEEYKVKLVSYLCEEKTYKANTYQLSEEEKKLIEEELEDYLKTYNYL